MKSSKLVYIIIAIGFIASESMLVIESRKGTTNMNANGSMLAFFIAVLSLLISIVVAILNVRSGNKRIDKIDERTEEIKVDIGSKTNQIQIDTKEINSYIMQELKSKTNNNEEMHKDLRSMINALYSEHIHKEKSKREYSSSNKDLITSSVEKIYSDNVALILENKELKIHLQELMSENSVYKRELESAREKLQEQEIEENETRNIDDFELEL